MEGVPLPQLLLSEEDWDAEGVEEAVAGAPVRLNKPLREGELLALPTAVTDAEGDAVATAVAVEATEALLLGEGLTVPAAEVVGVAVPAPVLLTELLLLGEGRTLLVALGQEVGEGVTLALPVMLPLWLALTVALVEPLTLLEGLGEPEGRGEVLGRGELVALALPLKAEVREASLVKVGVTDLLVLTLLL